MDDGPHAGARRAPPLSWDSSAHYQDVVQKALVSLFRDGFMTWHQLDLPALAEALPTELPTVTVRAPVVDALFRTVTDDVVHLEFQAGPERTLYRFAQYAAALAERYPGANLHMVVVYLNPVQSPPSSFDVHALAFQCTNVVVGALDGVPVWERVQQRARDRGPWTPEAFLDMAYAPFVRHPTLSKSDRARAVAELAVELTGESTRAAAAALLGLTGPFLPAADVNYLQEVLKVNPLVRQLLDEGRQEGRHEGRVLMMERVLTAKFGPLPHGVRELLEGLTTDAAWAAVDTRLVAAASLTDVYAILQKA